MTSRRQESGDKSPKERQIEARLAEVESQPGFRQMMQQSASDIKVGQVLTHAQVKKRLGKRA